MRNDLICLGIESTAHTFGAAVIDSECTILSNEKDSHSTTEGGLIPRELAEHHLAVAKKVVDRALEKAGIGMSEVDLFAFSQGPGMGPALKVGAVAARSLAIIHNKPLLGVNHCVAHIEIGKKLCCVEDPLVVYVSGANTQIIGYESGCYRVYGETIDIGLGNLLDSFGRALGLGFPAGPEIDRMYFEGKNYLELPYSVKGMDLIFSGLLTAAEQKIGKADKTDLCYSLMHTALAMLTEVSERALAHTEKDELLITGGVAASRALQQMLRTMCEERGCAFHTTPNAVAQDNAAMIAWLGLLMHGSGVRMSIAETKINQRFRTDQVEVSWI